MRRVEALTLCADFENHKMAREQYLEMGDALLTAIQVRIIKNSSDRLKAAARKSWQYLHTAVMALHTDMRRGEILKLRWENVNWGTGHVTKLHGKPSNPASTETRDGKKQVIAAMFSARTASPSCRSRS